MSVSMSAMVNDTPSSENDELERIGIQQIKVAEPKHLICWYIYVSHFLSAWGDRMWQFGVGLFLVIISPDSLRVTAVYGFASGGATLVFGPVVGRWVDRTPRLTAARVSLVVQNLSVALCSVILWTLVTYMDSIISLWSGQALLYIFYSVIILVAIVANLSSIANTIAVEKDWIVVICKEDKNLFAATSARLKSIDLLTNILAPVLTGQIMTFWSVQAGALFIGGWNLVSVCVEFYLLQKVYDTVPELSAEKKQLWTETDSTTEPDTTQVSTSRVLTPVISLLDGWRTYMRYNVVLAGVGLAFLYMTVLGFDNVTVGYAYTQGISESIMGVLMAAGAFVGILGTVAYPRVRRKVGQVRSGLVGFTTLIMFLSVCLVSIWSPGSPFNVNVRSPNAFQTNNDSIAYVPFVHDLSDVTTVKSDGENVTTAYVKSEHTYSSNGTLGTVQLSINASLDSFAVVLDQTTATSDTNVTNIIIDMMTSSDYSSLTPQQSFVSIVLLLTGIVGARFGLWMTDLTITQLFLDHVTETERGVVMGVQTSLNQLMDMLKFALVIALPEPEVFGYLILISFAFAALGYAFYARFSYRERGHILPLHAVKVIPRLKGYNELEKDKTPG